MLSYAMVLIYFFRKSIVWFFSIAFRHHSFKLLIRLLLISAENFHSSMPYFCTVDRFSALRPREVSNGARIGLRHASWHGTEKLATSRFYSSVKISFDKCEVVVYLWVI